MDGKGTSHNGYYLSLIHKPASSPPLVKQLNVPLAIYDVYPRYVVVATPKAQRFERTAFLWATLCGLKLNFNLLQFLLRSAPKPLRLNALQNLGACVCHL
ncbi:hypothetical protein BS333_18480 [Vibrio azureus]|nr:hypothetical protein BS333_18480 [Vibrio azureus]